MIAVVVIAVALLVPQGVAAIPLTVDYVVGEKMIYDSKVNVSMEYDDQRWQRSWSKHPPVQA